MFDKRMRFLTYMSGIILIAVIVVFGIMIFSMSVKKTSVKAGDNVAYAMGVYDSVTQADYNNLKTGTCPICGSTNCKMISSERELAAVFRFAESSNGLSACYAVTQKLSVDLLNWTDSTYPAIGKTADRPFTGHFDFGNSEMRTYSDRNFEGIIPYATECTISRLRLIHSGRSQALGQIYKGSTVVDVAVSACIPFENLNQEVSQSAMLLNTLENNGGTAGEIKNATATYTGAQKMEIINHAGFAVNTTGNIINCKTLYDEGEIIFGGSVAGIALNMNGGSIRDCQTRMLVGDRRGVSGTSFSGIAGGGNGSVTLSGNTTELSCDLNGYQGQYFDSVSGILGRMNEESADSFMTIQNCTFTGKDVYGGFSGISFNVAGTTLIDNCNVSVGNVYYLSAANGITSGTQLYSTAYRGSVSIKRCEVVAKKFEWSKANPAVLNRASGIYGVITRELDLNIEGCSVYMDAITLRGKTGASLGGMVAYCNVPSSIITIKAFQEGNAFIKNKCYIKSLSTENLGGDLVGGYGSVTLYVTDTEYMETLGKPCGISLRTGSTSTDTMKTYRVTESGYTAAESEIAEKQQSGGNAETSVENSELVSVKIEVESAGRVNVKLSFSSDAVQSQYRIRDLYLSVSDYGLDRYTQLIYCGRVVGYMGTGSLPIDSTSVQCTADGLSFTYSATPNSAANVYVKIVLEDQNGKIAKYILQSK